MIIMAIRTPARTAAINYFNRPFQALTQDVFFRADIAFSALKTSIYLFIGLFKFTYFLTYLLIYLLYAGGAHEPLSTAAILLVILYCPLVHGNDAVDTSKVVNSMKHQKYKHPM